MRTPLPDVLHEARSLGFLGPAPIEGQIRHAEVLTELLTRESLGIDGWSGPPLAPDTEAATRPGAGEVPRSATVLDLGSGGGLPGLVVALRWPAAAVTLLDASTRRCEFLRKAVVSLRLDGRCEIVQGRAEELAHVARLRERFDIVTARSFAGPAVTAECAAGFVRVGGCLVTAEPPGSPDRWPTQALDTLGFGAATAVAEEFSFAVLHKLRVSPERFPRRTGVPEKRPLF